MPTGGPTDDAHGGNQSDSDSGVDGADDPGALPLVEMPSDAASAPAGPGSLPTEDLPGLPTVDPAGPDLTPAGTDAVAGSGSGTPDAGSGEGPGPIELPMDDEPDGAATTHEVTPDDTADQIDGGRAATIAGAAAAAGGAIGYGASQVRKLVGKGDDERRPDSSA